MSKQDEPALEALNSPANTSSYLGVPVHTLAQWRYQKVGLPYVRIGRLIRYRREDILEFISANLQEVA